MPKHVWAVEECSEEFGVNTMESIGSVWWGSEEYEGIRKHNENDGVCESMRRIWWEFQSNTIRVLECMTSWDEYECWRNTKKTVGGDFWVSVVLSSIPSPPLYFSDTLPYSVPSIVFFWHSILIYIRSGKSQRRPSTISLSISCWLFSKAFEFWKCRWDAIRIPSSNVEQC